MSATGRQGQLRLADSETLVVIDEETMDVCVQSRATGALRRLLVHSLLLAFGGDPFFPLSISPHTPRLRPATSSCSARRGSSARTS